MSVAACTNCGRSYDTRTLLSCPDCGAFVCGQCLERYGGCRNCFEEPKSGGYQDLL